MMDIIRALIYDKHVNKFLRGLMKIFEGSFPDKYKLNPSGTVKLNFSDSISIRLKANQTSYILRELYWGEPMEYEYTSIFVELIKDIGSFWDVGANIGYYSILACVYNPKIKVHAFEPSLGPKFYLNENIAINNVGNQVIVHSQALSLESGKIAFYEVVNPKFPKILNLSGEHNMGTKKGLNSKEVIVESIRMDDIDNHPQAVELIKIDVEGAEVMVLKGGLKLLQKDRPIVICEVLYNQNEAELESVMEDLNYLYYAHMKNGLMEIGTLKRKKDNGIRNVFFVPAEKKGLIERFIIK
ncbi:FkbM family methyltransferase [Muricauda sp. CAU 1633]|uniref:FkbM family methyltransferase n=1 Tax=Allomuricauda sp. CAU 1633 TaxID=2816036 RepID=UPI001A8C9D95|nr:FkbM family methyltransferase [Muricauda sp. CAU 1633]MBO0321678.1 FkbM family methyltransferase [Muricauda sp. CAU 1633]